MIIRNFQGHFYSATPCHRSIQHNSDWVCSQLEFVSILETPAVFVSFSVVPGDTCCKKRQGHIGGKFHKGRLWFESMSPMAPVCWVGVGGLGGAGDGGSTAAPSQTAVTASPADSSQPRERAGEAERGEGDINPMSYIKRNTIRVRERWDALKWMITDSLKITAA